MKPYDPKQRYFGPQGSQLCKVIPEYPIGLPQLQPIFNEAAYHHDVGYEGARREGFWGGIKDALERRRIDKKFKRQIKDGIDVYYALDLITDDEADTAEDYADLAYTAVRLGGWTFFRTDERLI